MQAHQLIKTKKVSRRIGRGGKRGTYSGRGIKGQKARAGRRIRPQIRDIIKKIHKARGYAFASFRKDPYVVNIEKIDKKFKNGETITPELLVKSGLVKAKKGEKFKIKVLGKGKTDKKFVFDKNILISKTAKNYAG
ncbi:MAG: uL15 family ribosomal protein [Patescibacteria group bacterium]